MKYSIALLSLTLCIVSVYADTTQKISSSLFASAVGDALGRVTEFIPTLDAQFRKYPTGVHRYSDFTQNDWTGIPAQLQKQKHAPYTDDTAMALLVAETLIEAKAAGWDQETTMSSIAQKFIHDLKNYEYGWAASFRAPGNACLSSTRSLSQKQHSKGWWDAHASQAGGCGSVMRAFPFGLVFYDDPEKAALWAAEHSKITHGHPMARAACAAMAKGTALALQGSLDHAQIIKEMIKTAQTYDQETAKKMKQANAYASAAKSLIPIDLQKNSAYRKMHEKVFSEFEGWAAHDAIAATVFVFAMFPKDITSALYVSVHTQGDSDSIAAMSGALIGAYSGVAPNKELIDNLENSEHIAHLAQNIDKLTQQHPLETDTQPLYSTTNATATSSFRKLLGALGAVTTILVACGYALWDR